MKRLRRFVAVVLVLALVFSVNTNVSAEYTVQKGDFLWKIAAEQLGDGYRFKEIYELNKDLIKDINLIYPGQIFAMPGDVAETEKLPGMSVSKVGDKVNGFVVSKVTDFDLINAEVIILTHEKTGAKVMYLANDDTNRLFEITFRTPALNDTGIPHVFEHSTLDGSEKYPSKSLFFNLSYQTYNTYMNASTYNFMTTFPIASLSEAQLLKYADYYTDSCFNPIVCDNDTIFKEEAWRYVLPTAEDELTIAGTVYSEMKGAYSLDSAASTNFIKTMFPGSTHGNVSGGHPDYIPDLTWEDLCAYHDTYYHPSNSYTCMYGKFDDMDSFLKLLDGYFSKYEKKDIVINDDKYEPITESIEKVFEYGLEEGSDTDKGATVYYGFGLDTDDIDVMNRYDLLTTLIGDQSSPFMKNMKKELPYATTACYIDFTVPGSAVVFAATGINEEDAATFKSVVDKSLATIAKKGFDMEAVDAIVAAYKLDVLLTTESSEVGTSIVPNIMYYWASTGDDFGYMKFVDSLDNFRKYAEDGTFKKLVKKDLLGEDTVTALVTTVPVAGLKEKQEAALAAKLAEYKASLSEAEINALVEATAAYGNEEPEDNTEYIKQLTAVTVDSLPEEARIYDYTDITGEDGIRRIDVAANVDGLGEATILLDAKGLDQESLQFFKLYTDLLGSLDTENYTVAQLSSKITRYLYSPTVKVSLMDVNTEEKYHPYLRASFIAMDEDMQAAYDLIGELLYNTKFDNLEQLKGEVTALKSATKSSLNSNIYSAQIYRLASARDEMYGYLNYINYFDYYEFLCQVEEVLDSEYADYVVEYLESVSAYFNNNTNAISGFVGNETSAANHRAVADAFIAKLDTAEIVPQEYKFAEIPESEGIIIDSSVQYNAIFADLDALGLEKVTGDMDAITAYVSDTYLYPMIRDQYGAYSILHGMFSNGMYIVSYRDPNVLETYGVYAMLPELVKSLTEVDQETLDGYILSNYSYYALSQGELTGGYNAMFDVIGGFEQSEILDNMKALKSITPESAAKYAELYTKLLEGGYISTAGGASAINGNAALFESVLNPFGSVDKSQIALKDVNEDDSFYEAVRYAYEAGYMDAWGEDTFGVDEAATLGEFANILYLMLGGENDPVLAIDYLAYFGIIPAGNVDDVLTREELVVYLYYFCSALGIEYPEPLNEVLPLEGLENPEDTADRTDLAVATYILDNY